MSYGFFYKRKIPKKDTIVIGKILNNIENISIEVFLLEYKILAYMDISYYDNNKYNFLKESDVFSFLVIGKKNNRIQLSNKYIKEDFSNLHFYNKYLKIVSCLVKISKLKNIDFFFLANKTIWNNNPDCNLFYFYLIKMNKLNIININYNISNNIIKLIQKYYNPIINYNKIEMQLIVKNEYDYIKTISSLKEKIESLEFLSFNINKIPIYSIVYDQNFWYNTNLLLKILNKIITNYKKFFIKIKII